MVEYQNSVPGTYLRLPSPTYSGVPETMFPPAFRAACPCGLLGHYKYCKEKSGQLDHEYKSCKERRGRLDTERAYGREELRRIRSVVNT